VTEIEIRASAEKTDGENPAAALLFLSAGVYGVLLFLRALDGSVYAGRTVYLTAAAACLAVWYVYFYKRKLFYWFLPAAALVCCFIAFLLRDTLHAQAIHIMNGLTGRPAPEPELARITEFAALLAAAWPLLLFAVEFLIRDHAALYLLTTALILLAPLLGIRAELKAIVPLALFQTSLWLVRRSGKNSAAIILVLILAFLIAYPLAAFHSQALYDSVYAAEGFVYRTLRHLSGAASEPVTGGRISRGNNHRTGAAHLELRASVQPAEVLYLRGFGGGVYTGGDWIRSSDEALFAEIEKNPEWNLTAARMGSLYYGMYFNLNDRTREEASPEPITLTVIHSGGEYRNAYVPYGSQRGRYGTQTGGDGYVYRYFEQKDMNVHWDNVAPDFEETAGEYRRLQAAYTEAIQTAYTQVPTELLPRLTALAEDHPLEDPDEITAFILHTLHGGASYTLTPGWAAFGEDVTEYFLFESGRGYCVHFAAAAALMYRLYGVPARYASGYMIPPGDFEPQEDGTFLAVASDASAHAWAEIFLEDYGWTPVEVTPDSGGSAAASYPGFDSVKLNRLLKEHGWDLSAPGPAERVGDDAGDDAQTAGSSEEPAAFDFGLYFERHRDAFLALGTCLIYSVLLLPLLLDYRRLRRLRRLDAANCRAVFSRLTQLLRFGGYLREFDGTEDDFAERYAAAVPAVTREEAARLLEIVGKAAYGPAAPEEAEEEFVRKICRATAGYVYAGLTRPRKLVFRYIKGFG
jgi:transglutaminase-like putative cysteine protease